MREVEKSAKTINEAIDAALNEFGLSKDEVEIEILEEPSKGLFGLIGTRDAKVRITEKIKKIHQVETVDEENLEQEQKAVNILHEIFECMKLDVKIDTLGEEGGYIKVNLTGPDLGILIGRRGDTLDALQYFVNLAANRNSGKRIRFVLDVEGYRQRREETLNRLAFKLADKAKRKRQDVVLEPMNPHERRIIHTALQNNKDVFTFSEGEEPYRKIIIAPKK